MRKSLFSLILLLCVGASFALMAAPRDTPETTGSYVALAAGEALDQGVLAGVGTDGKMYAVANDKALTVIGRVERTAASGARAIVRRGVFNWAQSGTNTANWVTAADIGKTVYVGATASTVSLTPGGAYTNSLGKVWNVDAVGVWVRSGF